MLYVVIGPPAGGKSTWVQQHAKPGDIVIDFDLLAVALSGPGGDPHDHPSVIASVAKAARNAAIDIALRHIAGTDVYLIHSSPGRQRMAEYQAMGAKVITVDPGRDVVRRQASGKRPARMYGVIDQWYREQAQAAAPSAAPAPVHSFPVAASREW